MPAVSAEQYAGSTVRQRLADMLRFYAETPRERWSEVMEQRVASEPRCAVTRYLLGCVCFDRGRAATAVRHMMVAHHAGPQLQSAALLAFAGLNWMTQRGAKLLPVLLDTWNEFRRPEFDRTRNERRVLDAFAERDPGLDHVSLLARRLWRLPILTLRAQIREVIMSKDAGLYPLLAAPA